MRAGWWNDGTYRELTPEKPRKQPERETERAVRGQAKITQKQYVLISRRFPVEALDRVPLLRCTGIGHEGQPSLPARGQYCSGSVETSAGRPLPDR